MQRSFSSSNSVLSNKPVNVVPLANMFDEDDDQLSASQWPASPPKKSSTSLPPPYKAKPAPALGNGKGTNSAAASNAHWGNKTSVLNNLNNPAKPVNKNKRQFPWEHMADPVKKPKATLNDKGAYHTLAGSGASSSAAVAGPSKSNLLTGKALNIKQKVMLSSEQQKILTMVVDEGKNIFFTGSAGQLVPLVVRFPLIALIGTGKSVLLREIIASMKNKYRRPDAVAITASTGMAACNIGGTTIHSFAGIGLGLEPVPELVNKIRKNRKAVARWQKAQCLIIDEVSMVDGELFDKLSGIACALRKKPDKPFGGIQLIVTGDFCQYSPSSSDFAHVFA